jgi:hypothetical protein
MRLKRLFPIYEVTFPYVRVPQKANDLYERRRLVTMISRRQHVRRSYAFRIAWRGLISFPDFTKEA